MPIVEGEVAFVGAGSTQAHGDNVATDLSAIDIGGKRLRKIRLRDDLTNFRVGDSIRLLYYTPVLPIDGYRHMGIAVDTPNGRFTIGWVHALLAFVCLHVLFHAIVYSLVVGIPAALVVFGGMWLLGDVMGLRLGDSGKGMPWPFYLVPLSVGTVYLWDIARFLRTLVQFARF